MTSRPGDVGIGSFVSEFGDVECRPEDVPGFAEIWSSGSNANFETMGCGSFRKMSAPVEEYIVDCVKQTLGNRDTAAKEIDYVVFATTDACLGFLGRDFTARVLDAIGMVSCVPVVLSFQQCCSSVTALRYGWDLFSDQEVDNVVLVSFDFTPNDSDRIRSFAFFGDAVTSCLISRANKNDLRLVSSAINVDYAGLVGRDSFESRQKVARASLSKVCRDGGTLLKDVTKVFPTNLYGPLTLFNAMVAGIHQGKLYFTDTLYSYGHCGNCDWMINLANYEKKVGIHSGETYLAQTSAPGFFACGLLVAI